MGFLFSMKVSSSNESKKWSQILAVLLASFSSITIGIHFAWPSPSLPKILSDDFPVNVTTEESSYIVSIRPLGNMFAAPLAGYLADTIGRKYTILLIAVPTFISWMIFAFANSVLEFYIGRFISGFGDGFYFICYSMYIGEVTEPSIRGVVCGNISVLLMFGMLLISCYGPYVSIRDGAMISSIFPILLVICFIWMPESPYYLIMKRKLDKAKNALYFLRRCNVDKEFQMLQDHVEKQVSERGSYKDLFTIPSNRRALFILMGIRTFQQLSGIAGLTMFTQSIFTQAGTNLSPTIASIIYFSMLLIATAWGSVFSDKYGRRPTLILSSLLTGIVNNVGGIYFLLQEVIGVDTSSIKWFPIFVMILFSVSYSFGMGTIPPLMLSELLSASVKSKALCIVCIWYSLITSFTLKLFYFLSMQFGLFASFFFYGEMCFLSCLFTYYFLPETKGKTLEEIQQNLNGYNEKKIAAKIIT